MALRSSSCVWREGGRDGEKGLVGNFLFRPSLLPAERRVPPLLEINCLKQYSTFFLCTIVTNIFLYKLSNPSPVRNGDFSSSPLVRVASPPPSLFLYDWLLFLSLPLDFEKRGKDGKGGRKYCARGHKKITPLPPFYFSLFFLVRCQKATSGGDTTPYGGPPLSLSAKSRDRSDRPTGIQQKCRGG